MRASGEHVGDNVEVAVGGLDVGGQQVHLIVGDVPPRLGQHYAVLVQDVDVAVASLRGQKVLLVAWASY